MALPPGWLPASGLRTGFEWRWTIGYGGGFHTNIVHADYFDPNVTLEQVAQMGIHCYMAFFAPLLCSSTRLEVQETTFLRNPLANRIDIPPIGAGAQPGPECDPDSVPVWVTHTADSDRWARRPLYFPGSPRSWIQRGVLTPEGASAHLTVAAGTILGFGECFMPGTLRMIRWHPGQMPFTPGTPDAPAYKNVVHIRVCSHTDKPHGGAV